MTPGDKIIQGLLTGDETALLAYQASAQNNLWGEMLQVENIDWREHDECLAPLRDALGAERLLNPQVLREAARTHGFAGLLDAAGKNLSAEQLTLVLTHVFDASPEICTEIWDCFISPEAGLRSGPCLEFYFTFINKMNDNIYEELVGAAWISNRNENHHKAIVKLVENYDCSKGDFFTDDPEIEHPDVDAFLTHLFTHPESSASYIGWSGELGLISMCFECGGAVTILWEEDDISLPEAVRRMSLVFEVMSADAGYVTISGSSPYDSDAFRLHFFGMTLHRFGALP